MNKEEFIDNFSIDLTNTTVKERKDYAEKIFNIINDLQQQVFNKTLEIKGIEEVLKAKEQECEQKDKDIKYSMKCLDNSFKTQQDSELYWEREKKKLKAEKEKLKQTLIEIQQDLEFATYCESQECGCDDANECLECTKNHILQKISECEVENAR